jgi:hypothetical protein
MPVHSNTQKFTSAIGAIVKQSTMEYIRVHKKDKENARLGAATPGGQDH